MQREITWSTWDGQGLEHLRLAIDESGIRADSLIIGIDEGVRFRAAYHLTCDPDWRARTLKIDLLGERSITLQSDGNGHWQTREGESLPALDGCIDVDITATPFTNTLPIRRLGLQVGESQEILTLWVLLPSLEIKAARQRYTRLEAQRYRFEDPLLSFTAELPVDEDGLVLDDPDLFRRIYPK
jgi:hypothetical protein